MLKSLLIIGALSGLILGSTGAFVPLVFPKMFSPDPLVITEVSSLLVVVLGWLVLFLNLKVSKIPFPYIGFHSSRNLILSRKEPENLTTLFCIINMRFALKR